MVQTQAQLELSTEWLSHKVAFNVLLASTLITTPANVAVNNDTNIN